MIRSRYKYIFTLIGMISILMSCTSPADDIITPDKPDVPDVPGVPEVVQTPIKFSSSELKTESATRAGLETTGVNSFYVWSYKTSEYDSSTGEYSGLQTIMNQYKVQYVAGSAGSTTSNGFGWEYVGITDHGQTQNIKYWDYDATSYRYFGIAPASTTGITTEEKGGEYQISFHADASSPSTAPYISKLWISNNDYEAFPNHPYGGAVVMEFMKPVTKVRIILVSEDGTEILDPTAVGVTSMSFAPSSGEKIVQKGTLTVAYPMQGTITFTQYLPRLSVVGDSEGSLEIKNISTKTDDEHPGYQQWYYVLPHIEQTAFQLSLKVGSATKMATVPQEMMRWNPNMEYTYKFKLTASDVQFIDIVQIGVTKWQTEDETHPIYNW